MEGVEEGVLELLTDGCRIERGMMGFGAPLRIEGIEGVREEGNEDKDACRVRFVFALVAVPFVEGRYERTDAILLVTTSSVSGESVTQSHQSAPLQGFI